jgi:nitroreductase
MQAIRGRRAVRDFTEASVSKAQVSALVDTAIQAPSAMNRQAWSFTVIADRALLARAAAAAKAHRVATLDARPELAGLRERLASPDFDIFYNAPVLVVISATADDAFATVDCCLAAQTFMLAAYAEGFGTCWIGLSDDWLNLTEGKAMLGIPEHHRPVAPIILGHPRAWPAPTARRPAEVRWLGL